MTPVTVHVHRSRRSVRCTPAGIPAQAQVPSAPAQVPAATTANLKLIFDSTYFDTQRFGPARWIEDGTAYTTVERSTETKRGRDIVRYDTKNGARTILVPASSLIPPGDSIPLAIADYTWSADAKRLLIFTNTEKVWRQNTRGDYWVLDRTASTLQQVGSQAPKSSLMYAKFSPQGDRVAYVTRGDIYVERLADQSVTRLTTGADSLHVNGMSDWVYEEEFSLRDGFRWSPDGEKIAFWHFDMTGVGTFLMLNNTDSVYPFTVPIQYPLVGTPIPPLPPASSPPAAAALPGSSTPAIPGKTISPGWSGPARRNSSCSA
jgi:dipeptidyl-peptidase-4